MSDVPDTLWRCENVECGATLRPAELRRLVTPGLTIEVCPHCGGPVTVTGAAAVLMEDETRARIPSFASALAYPFLGWGLFVLGVGTFLVGLLAFGLPFLYGYVINVLVYGYMCNYLFDVVLSTAHGEDSPPGFPDFTSWWEDVLQPILLVLSTTVICFAPSFLYFIWYLWHCWYEGWVPEPSEPVCAVGVIGLALISSFYFPMALLAVVMFNARRVVDPRFVIPAILRVPKPYLVVCGFMILTGLIRVGFGLAFHGNSLLVHFAGVFLRLWGAMVSMRLLGLLYRVHQDKLRWF